MTLDCLASEPQYLTTLAPIWRALPVGVRGEFMVPDHLFPDALARGVEPAAWHEPASPVALVASARDLNWLRGRPAILAEHGAGQSYAGDPASARHQGYAGGDGRENVILFLCPGEQCAYRNRLRGGETVVIGNPRLDDLRKIPTTSHPETIAFAFHWSAEVCPESGTAWYHWRDHLDMLGEHFRLLGTGHPRGYQEMADWYDKRDIIPVESFDLIVAEADILIADNTSVMYDWAALGRPVVALNAPQWRRNVHHGLRFWDAVPGVQADDPADLLHAVEHCDDKAARKLRAHGAQAAYGHLEGAAQYAADAICDALERRADAHARH